MILKISDFTRRSRLWWSYPSSRPSNSKRNAQRDRASWYRSVWGLSALWLVLLFEGRSAGLVRPRAVRKIKIFLISAKKRVFHSIKRRAGCGIECDMDRLWCAMTFGLRSLADFCVIVCFRFSTYFLMDVMNDWMGLLHGWRLWNCVYTRAQR